MNDNNGTCPDHDGAAAGTGGLAGAAAVQPSSADVLIEVVSDVICPWCYLGKRRLEKALGLLGDPAAVRVAWRPFRLNPGMPPGGMDRRAYRTAKFGSWERSLALDAQVAAAGEGEGIVFAFDRMARTPNTLDAHRLLWLAGQRGMQNGVAESLFRGYFTEGRDLNDRPTLVALAAEGGVPTAAAARLLGGDEGRAEVLAEEARGKSLGVRRVPAFFVGGAFVVSGAVEPRLLADVIRRAGEVRP